jgi:hypothetical protein
VVKVSAWRDIPLSCGEPFIIQRAKGSSTAHTTRVPGGGLYSDSVLILPCSISFYSVPSTMPSRNTDSHHLADDDDTVDLESFASRAELSQPRQFSSSHDEHDKPTVLLKNKTSL